MGIQELWFGTGKWGQQVEVALIHSDIWPGIAWRVEWGPPGSREREVFSGDRMEQRARAFFAEKTAELGTDWRLVRSQPPS